jgi:ribosomal protein S19E (S16A)
MALYKKYYRTQHARLKAKTKKISQLELSQWAEKARKARELTADGRYSLEEFEKFLKGEESEIKIP